MIRAVLLTTLASLALTAGTLADGPKPADQYRELRKEYNTVGSLFRAAKTDQERKAAVEQFCELPKRFIDLAEQNPREPVALTALRQAVQGVISADSLAHHCAEMNREAFPIGSRGEASRIVKVLLRDHIRNDKLAPICDRMRFGVRKEFEAFLTAALKTNPDRDVQGMASLALAQLLRTHLQMIDLMADRPELNARYEFIYGKGYVEAIRGAGRAALAKRVEKLYERALEFDDVTNIPFRTTVAEKAKTELYDLRNLSIGKLAPDVEGPDQDGRQFKLSDYRGKVVLLYFWQEY